MNVDFTNRGTISATNTTALYYASLYSGRDLALFAMDKISPVTLGVSVFFNFAGAVLASPNTQLRIYDFIVPVNSTYVFQCALKGDLDNPRNRVRVISSTGAVYLDYQESFTSDVLRALSAQLPPGFYSVEVSLGSGSSSYFHTAGNLNWIHLWNANPLQFTLPLVCTVNQASILSIFPSPGAVANMQVDFQGFPSSNPNIINGSVYYNNLRPYPGITVAPDYPNSSLRAINKPIHVIQPQFHLLSPPSFNGVRSIVSIQRDADWEYDLYPDDWYDQDGDGIPDPPGGYY